MLCKAGTVRVIECLGSEIKWGLFRRLEHGAQVLEDVPDKSLAPFSVKGHRVNISGFLSHMVCHNNSILPLWQESSREQYAKRWELTVPLPLTLASPSMWSPEEPQDLPGAY